MKTMSPIVALCFAVGLASSGGCFTEGEEELDLVSETEQELGGSFKMITYYNNANHDVMVGNWVYPSPCTNGTSWGKKSAYYELEWIPCN